MAALLTSYQNWLARSPLIGNSISSAVCPLSLFGCPALHCLDLTHSALLQVLFATGDGIAQQFVEKKVSQMDDE